MKLSQVLIFYGLIMLYSANVQAAEPNASRPPWPGCQWERKVFKELGVTLLFQNCKEPSAHYELSVKGNWLEMHRPSDDVTYGGPRLLQVFTKSSTQNIKQALKNKFIKTIALENRVDALTARTSCRVFPLENFSLGTNKFAFTLSPTGRYKQKIYHELKTSPRDFGCGEYGQGQSLTYFEYHPEESSTKFAFVVYGQDEPLFDEKSIQFVDQ